MRMFLMLLFLVVIGKQTLHAAPGFSGRSRGGNSILAGQSAGAGLTLGVGGPSGISGHMDMGDGHYVQGLFGFEFVRSIIDIAGDYIVPFPGYLETLPDLIPFLGLGVFIHGGKSYKSLSGKSETDDLQLGSRVPVGAFYVLPQIPLQLYGNVAVGLILSPKNTFVVGVEFGARYLFSI